MIAAKAVCFGDALKPEFAVYQKQILLNAKALAAGMLQRGYALASGGTDNHLMLVDLRAKYPELTGKVAQESLDRAHITCNKNTVPFETRSPFQASGIRLGTPAVTSRGLREAEMARIAEAIDLVLGAPESEEKREAARAIVKDLTTRFPLPYRL